MEGILDYAMEFINKKALYIGLLGEFLLARLAILLWGWDCKIIILGRSELLFTARLTWHEQRNLVRSHSQVSAVYLPLVNATIEPEPTSTADKESEPTADLEQELTPAKDPVPESMPATEPMLATEPATAVKSDWCLVGFLCSAKPVSSPSIKPVL